MTVSLACELVFNRSFRNTCTWIFYEYFTADLQYINLRSKFCWIIHKLWKAFLRILRYTSPSTHKNTSMSLSQYIGTVHIYVHVVFASIILPNNITCISFLIYDFLLTDEKVLGLNFRFSHNDLFNWEKRFSYSAGFIKATK